MQAGPGRPVKTVWARDKTARHRVAPGSGDISSSDRPPAGTDGDTATSTAASGTPYAFTCTCATERSGACHTIRIKPVQ